MTLLLVAVAGAIGAPARFVLERALTRPGRLGVPWGTFVVNVTGSLALGLVAGAAARHGLSTTTVAIAGSGFLGAYTTFSTFVYEAVRRAEAGAVGVAATYVGASIGVGTAAAIVGLAITGAF